MMQKLYRFAGLEICISMPEDMMFEEDRWLAPFRTEQVEDPHTFVFQRVETLPPPEGEPVITEVTVRTFRKGDQTMRYLGPMDGSWETGNTLIEESGKYHRVSLCRRTFPGKITVSTVLQTLDARRLMLEKGGVILHCAFIEHEGRAVLFTAPCQTGKTTQAELWNQFRGARIVNGDRAAIRVLGDTVLAEGLPYCGSSRYSENGSVPLEAVVYLAQAPETTIRRLRGFEAFARVWEGVTVDTRNREDLERASETVEKILCKVPVYYMPCTPDEQAVAVLDRELRKQARECDPLNQSL